jgi:4-aminobutyrate aminotransferase-like enzyme
VKRGGQLRNGFVPDPAAAKEIVRKAADMGLILLTCGNMGNVIRILMLLTIPDAILEEGLALLDKALTL